MQSYTLPMSPSTNAMYRRSKYGYGLYKTQDAKEWVLHASKLVNPRKTYRGKVDISIRLYFQREADIDNRIKPILDLLQDRKVIDNDKQVYSLLVTKFFDKENPRCEVSVMENE